MDIINSLLQHPEKDKLVNQHGLGGYLFKYSDDKESYENHYLQQWHINQVYYEEFKKIQEIAFKKSISCEGIKGIFLINALYDDFGLRKMSDIDLLTSSIKGMTEILISQKFKPVSQSDFKCTYSKQVEENEIVIELHSRLYSKQDFQLLYEKGNLSLSEHFYFMVYHLSYQHTFMRLNWLIDLALFLKKYPQDIEQILELARQRGHERAFNITFYLLNQYCNLDIKTVRLPFMSYYNGEFLLRPYNNKFKYYLLKHLTKKNIRDAIAYDLNWFLKKVR